MYMIAFLVDILSEFGVLLSLEFVNVKGVLLKESLVVVRCGLKFSSFNEGKTQEKYVIPIFRQLIPQK